MVNEKTLRVASLLVLGFRKMIDSLLLEDDVETMHEIADYLKTLANRLIMQHDLK